MAPELLRDRRGARPDLHVDRLLWGLAAFALAVGVARTRSTSCTTARSRTGLSDRALLCAARSRLLGALAIGVAGVVTVSALAGAAGRVAGALFLPAYNLELAGGRFHSDVWFAIGWGAFPAFTGYFVNSLSVALPGVLIAAGCLAIEPRPAATQLARARAAPPHALA